MSRYVRCILLRGQGGIITSSGIDQLGRELDALRPVRVDVLDQEEYNTAVGLLRETPTNWPKVLIGFSLGANWLPWIAGRVGRMPIVRLYGIDPSRLDRIDPVPDNVEKAVCFYHPKAWIFGGARYTGHNVETVWMNVWHLLIGSSKPVHDRIIGDVRQLCQQLGEG